jgi:hypothetical protein
MLLGDPVSMIDWGSWGYEASINKYDLGKNTIDRSQIKLIGNDDLNNYYPALLLPYRDKDEFTMPLRHFFNMQHYLQCVETLVIIGWKGNEDSFNSQLIQQTSQVKKVVIADPQPDVVKHNLKELFLRAHIETIVYKDFEDFVMNGVDKELTGY